METILKDSSEIKPFLKKILNDWRNYKLWLLKGNLGSGKTTLAKDLIALLGGKGTVTSPTYTIINEHESDNDNKLFHIDAYRLEDKEQIIESLIDESLENPENYVIIEWPEKLKLKYLPPHIEISLEILKDGSRKISAKNIK